MNRTPAPVVFRPTLCFLLLLVLGGVPMALAEPVGKAEEVTGEVILIRGEHPPRPLKQGEALLAKDEVRTGKGGRVAIALPDGSRLELDENGRLRLARYLLRPQPEGLFDLWMGHLRALVGDLFSRKEESFRVRTPNAVLGVQGTDFEVRVAAEETRVEVRKGRVALANRDPRISGRVIVAAGEFSLVRKGRPPTKPRPLPAGWFGARAEGTGGAPRRAPPSGNPATRAPIPGVERASFDVPSLKSP